MAHSLRAEALRGFQDESEEQEKIHVRRMKINKVLMHRYVHYNNTFSLI